MAFWMGSICLSLASVPTIIQKLDDKGVLDRAGLGALADLKHMLGGGGDASIPTEGEIAGALTEVNTGGKVVSKRNAPPRVITPAGEVDEKDYRRLVSEAERLAPIALTRARLKQVDAGAEDGPPPDSGGAPDAPGEPAPPPGDPR